MQSRCAQPGLPLPGKSSFFVLARSCNDSFGYKYFDRETTSGPFKYEEYLVGVAESAHENFAE